MEPPVSSHDTGSTPTVSDPRVELANYPDGKSLPSKEDGADVPHEDPNPFHSLPREILFVGVVCVAQLTTQISLGQTLNLVHIIGDHFGTTNPGTLSWFVAGYSLTVGSFILLFGRIGDYFGYKRLFIVGLCWFSLWSMIAGVSNYSNDIFFIFSRVFQGIGPAMCLPNAVALLGATYPPGLRKNLVFAAFGAVAPGGAVIGAVFGGIFQNSWPWAFYSLALVLATAAVVSHFVIPNRMSETVDTHKLSRWQLLEKLDILGGSVGIIALTLINFAWNQAPATSWAEPSVITTLILGICLVVVFFLIETRVSSSPLIPLDIITLDIGFVIACISCGWATFGIWIYYSFQFFQQIRGSGPLLTSAYYAPAAISGALASIITGLLLQILHPAWVMTFSLTSFTIATVLVATAPVLQTYWSQTFVSMIFITWGIDMSFPAATIIMSNAVKPEHQGIAASLIMT
ncbi:hypothetical protein MMC32_002537 [Xylographa parallela]|nr:hypothetical protein [Xylographa parallela]